MAVNLEIILNDKKAVAAIQNLIRETIKLEKGLDMTGNSGDKAFDEISTSANKAEKNIEGVVKSIDKVDKSNKEASKSGNKWIKSFNRLLSDSRSTLSSFGSDIIDQIDSLNLFGLSVGKVRQAFSKLIATPIGAFLAVVASVGLIAKQWLQYNIQLDKNQKIVSDITGTYGQLNSAITAQAQAIEKTLGVSLEESLKSARSAVNSFGEDYTSVLDSLTDGLIRAGQDQNEFLDSIREYSVFFADAGFSFEEFANLVNTGIDLGIYTDKLPDAIKEFQISVTEQTTASKEALENAFGESFTNDLLGNIQSGAITTKEALQLISEESERVGINSQQAAQLTADLFRGAGEDAGGALVIFDALNRSLDAQQNQLTDLQKAQKETTELYTEIGLEFERAFGTEGVLLFTNNLKNFFLTAWRDFLASVTQLRQEFIAIGRVIKSGFTVGFKEALATIKIEEEFSRIQNELASQSKILAQDQAKNQEQQAKLTLEQQEKLNEQRLKAEEELLGKINELRQNSALAGIELIQDPEERVKAQYELAIKEIEKQEAAIQQLVKDSGGSEIDIQEEINTLKLLAEQEYYKALLRIKQQGQKEIEKLDQKTLDELLSSGKELSAEQQKLFDGALPGLDRLQEQNQAYADELERTSNLDVFENIKEKLANALSISPEELEVLSGALVDTFDSVFSSISSGIDSQVAEQDRLISSIQEREKAIRDSLDREIQLQKEGYANNVKAKEKELAELQAAEEEAVRKRNELKKKQIRLELLQQQAQQAVNLATAVSKIIAVKSGIPFVGIALAAASIASMFSLFQQAKSQAAEAAVVPSFYTGGSIRDVMSGYVEKGGKSDVPGRTKGYRVIDDSGRTRMRMGGSEFVMNELTSREHEPFLRELNAGKYKGVDLMKKLTIDTEPIRIAKTNNEVIVQRQKDRDFLTEKQMDKLLMKLADRISQDQDLKESKGEINGKLVIEKKGRKRVIR